MSEYRKRPAVVQAKQWWPPTDSRHDGSMLTYQKGNTVSPPYYRQIGDLWQFSPVAGVSGDCFMFRTANGDVRVNPGDWIVTDPTSGDSRPVPSDIFDKTYELCAAAEAANTKGVRDGE